MPLAMNVFVWRTVPVLALVALALLLALAAFA